MGITFRISLVPNHGAKIIIFSKYFTTDLLKVANFMLIHIN